jgi:hypothetical protein
MGHHMTNHTPTYLEIESFFAEGSDYDTTQEEIVVTYGGPTNVESGTGTTGTRNE